MNGSFALGIPTAWPAVTAAGGRGVVREAAAAPGQAGRAAPGACHTGRAGCAAQMELRAARAAARRRVGAYTAAVTAAGFALLVLATPGPPARPGRTPG